MAPSWPLSAPLTAFPRPPLPLEPPCPSPRLRGAEGLSHGKSCFHRSRRPPPAVLNGRAPSVSGAPSEARPNPHRKELSWLV